jgi:alpha-tubulin suppressor-like RCC1 family protein
LHFIDDGNLYTFGSGGYGCLGQNEGDKNQVTPKLVDFFQKNKLKVVDVAIGENHTLALTGFFFSFF